MLEAALQDYRPWAIRPAGLADMRTACAAACDIKAGLAGAEWLGGEGRTGHRLYDVVNGIALIPVYGTLVDVCYWAGSHYVTGYNVLRLQLADAFADPEVKGICLDVDSYGGLVTGLFDLADWIVEAKAEYGKPVAAILSEHAYSAAYALACTADTISVPRTGGAGSIGVIMVHWDYSKWLDKVGDKPTLIYSGAHKADGNSLEPLPDTVRADFQKQTDDYRLLFAEHVARARTAAGRKLEVSEVMATEAKCFDGPAGTAEAVKLGLADAVLPPAKAFQAFAAFVAAEQSAA